jgi:signal transduction histidine kinase
MGGLALAVVAILAAAGGLYRTTQRELTLARQQSDFVSAVSHEFRTPLTSMRHLTDLLRSRPVSEARRVEYYELLGHETERLHRMVEGLLSFGRIEAGAYAWKLERVDPADFVRSLLEDFRREPQAEGREVTCEIESGVPAVRADREALSRAVWNLLENAAKYSSDQSPIHVSARRQGNFVWMSVVDEGVGIPTAEQQKIFEKFVRGRGAQGGGVRGVGIGLALVKGIVEAHGGSVRLDSAPGKGSTFTLVIPCLES